MEENKPTEKTPARKPYKPPVCSEEDNQRTVVAWSRLTANIKPELNLLFHIPNQRMCKVALAVRLKSLGVMSGVPDLFLPVARGRYHGLFIEMKSAKGSMSPQQKAFCSMAIQQGYAFICCKSSKDGINALSNYIDSPPFAGNDRGDTVATEEATP